MTMGRPKAAKDKAKSEYVRVRVTASERDEIRRRWKLAKKNVTPGSDASANVKSESAWIRSRLLGDS